MYICEVYHVLDTLTHIALGACIGEAIAGKTAGKKAMVIGAIAQMVPDLDFLGNFWLDPVERLVAHRGITHSLLFVAVMTPALGWAVKKYLRPLPVSFSTCMLLMGVNMLAHIFIDSFNAYGTGWLEPFSQVRISFHTLFVVDPFFSFWLAVACFFLIRYPARHPGRKLWWRAGLLFSTLYLGYSVMNKMLIERSIRQNIRSQHITATGYLSTPTPLNNWLWFVAVKDANGYYTGYRSVLDRSDTIELHYVPRNEALLTQSRNEKETQKLVQFSQGYYSVENRFDTLLTFNVLRFGQVAGWHHPKAEFAFHYFLDRSDANDMVVQRGRFKNWGPEALIAMVKRICGR